MPYRPRELVVRAREAAGLLLATLDRNEMVARFLDMYAAEHRRPGRADHPYLYREQLLRIRRESILAMVLRIQMALPARLKISVVVRRPKARGPAAKRKKTAKKEKRKRQPDIELAIPFLDLFREEFFVALGQALEWNDEEAREFWRDLEFYEKLGPLGARPAGKRRFSVSGPFVDRVGLLLDPSMMEQARRDASKFEQELYAAADRVLREVFSRRRAN